jgi:large subunit ribosomal protein L13
MMYINADNHVLGRLASKVADTLLSGESVTVVNAGKSVIIGNPKAAIASYQEKIARGDPYHGPFYPRHPDMIFKRVVRGMIPRGTSRGREAFKRLRVFNSLPEDVSGKELTEMKGTANKGERKSISLKELSEKL